MSITKNSIFIDKAIAIHGNRYDYSNVVYINAKTKISIICKDHGEFCQTPTNHLSGYNCQRCAKNIKMNTDTFIDRANKIHSNIYDYSKVNYVNSNTKIVIICKQHGEFTQIPDFHLNRNTGCPKCADNVTLSITEFIEKSQKIHGDKYDYSQVSYVNNRTYINIICKNHGIFTQKQFSHLLGTGCPHCINKTEYKLWLRLKEKYPTVQRQFKAEWCKKIRCLPYDFMIEKYKKIIELDGPQHYEQVSNWRSPELQQERDLFKTKCANENGYSVIRVLQVEVAGDSFDFEKLFNCIENCN